MLLFLSGMMVGTFIGVLIVAMCQTAAVSERAADQACELKLMK